MYFAREKGEKGEGEGEGGKRRVSSSFCRPMANNVRERKTEIKFEREINNLERAARGAALLRVINCLARARKLLRMAKSAI